MQAENSGNLGLWICLPLPAWAVALLVGAASAAYGGALQAVAVVGLVLTGVSLLGLLGAWAAGLSVDRVGLLLPLYLTGAAVLAYPLVGLLGLLGSSGIGC